MDLGQQVQSLEAEKQRWKQEKRLLASSPDRPAPRAVKRDWKRDGGLLGLSLLGSFALGGLVSALLFIDLVWRGKIRRGRR